MRFTWADVGAHCVCAALHMLLYAHPLAGSIVYDSKGNQCTFLYRYDSMTKYKIIKKYFIIFQNCFKYMILLLQILLSTLKTTKYFKWLVISPLSYLKMAISMLMIIRFKQLI